jgi:hypothetical protein
MKELLAVMKRTSFVLVALFWFSHPLAADTNIELAQPPL